MEQNGVYALVYTRKGKVVYDSGHIDNYAGLTGLNCDVQDAVHLALSRDGKQYVPMRNNTGILFPRADFSSEKAGRQTKTLLDPWIFRRAEGNFGICAIRRNQNAPDPKVSGCMMLFVSEDLIRFEEIGFLQLDEEAVRFPRCRWEAQAKAYYVEWETKQGIFGGYTRYFHEVEQIKKCDVSSFETVQAEGIEDAVCGNAIQISEEEARRIENSLGEIRNTHVEISQMETWAGKPIPFSQLSRARCIYSDGSVHEKRVEWSLSEYAAIDWNMPGEYRISGKVYQKKYPFPFLDAFMSDPCICQYQGKYFLSGSGSRNVTLRISDTLDGLAAVEPIEIYHIPEEDTEHNNMWAPEMHVILGVPYLFTTVGGNSWTTVRSHVLRCNGNPSNPADWEAPRLVLKPDGTELSEGGISLDMTYFCVDGVHYVMWSDRKFVRQEPERAEPESADIYIATIDPREPWQLTTQPVCIIKPMYGWDRCETEVDEGPYLLRKGDDLFVTVSGSSTALGDLYCVGLLHARRGNNLLSPQGWDWLPYPVLTKESVPGEYGPGHNCFIKEPESGDDLMVYHAIPHDKDGRTLGRKMGIRRVHWAASGYPYLEMTPERDLAPGLEQVEIRIWVHKEKSVTVYRPASEQ